MLLEDHSWRRVRQQLMPIIIIILFCCWCHECIVQGNLVVRGSVTGASLGESHPPRITRDPCTVHGRMCPLVGRSSVSYWCPSPLNTLITPCCQCISCISYLLSSLANYRWLLLSSTYLIRGSLVDLIGIRWSHGR